VIYIFNAITYMIREYGPTYFMGKFGILLRILKLCPTFMEIHRDCLKNSQKFMGPTVLLCQYVMTKKMLSNSNA